MGNMTKITMHYTIFQLQCFVLLNNHQYNCNITKKSECTLFAGNAHFVLNATVYSITKCSMNNYIVRSSRDVIVVTN